LARPVGLRTELIVNLTLVLGAALLLSGLLLVRLAERHWVAQRVETVTNVMELTVSHWEKSRSPDSAEADGFHRPGSQPGESMRGLASRFDLTGWCYFDSNLEPVDCEIGPTSIPMARSSADRVHRSLETDVRVDYASSLWPWTTQPDASVSVTVPFRRNGEFAGALRGVFSFARMQQSITDMLRLAVLFALGYGLVLVIFGAYFLNRNIVTPVRRLMESTRRVQQDDLDQSIAGDGPGEVAELGRSFQEMLDTLKQSRDKTETTILSLRQANRELQRTRAELIRSEKLASVGHLAAGMAHEIGNPLGAVVGYLELLQTRLKGAAEQDMIARSLAEAFRIDRLIRDLLDFSAPGGAEAEPKDPVGLFREAVQLLDHQGAFKEIKIQDDMPGPLPSISIIPHQLVQVFVNLLLNARDASPPRGTIRLAGGADRGEVWLSIADEGEGIPPEQMETIFDPFFTTKDPGKGRGLGLSVCHRILNDAGGRIEVSSTPGKGSVFTVKLRQKRFEYEEG